MNGEILNISPAVVWVIALSQLLTFALTIWNIMASGSRANARRLDDHDKVLVEHGQRLRGVEQSQGASPTTTDMHGVGLALEGLRGEMKAMRAEMQGNLEIMKRVEAVVGRHENFLLEGARK